MQETIVYKPKAREKLFLELYQKAFPATAKYVQKMNGTLEEAKDIFQDALVIYYEKNESNLLEVQHEKAYILGIAKHLWLKKHKEKNKHLSLSYIQEKEVSLEEKSVQFSSAKLMNFLQTAGQKCMELLQSFYYEKMETSKIAEKYGYSSVRSATVQKFKCLEKIRNTVKEKSLDHEDFIE